MIFPLEIMNEILQHTDNKTWGRMIQTTKSIYNMDKDNERRYIEMRKHYQEKHKKDYKALAVKKIRMKLISRLEEDSKITSKECFSLSRYLHYLHMRERKDFSDIFLIIRGCYNNKEKDMASYEEERNKERRRDREYDKEKCKRDIKLRRLIKKTTTNKKMEKILKIEPSLKTPVNGIFTFGKHKNDNFSSIFEYDKGYAIWAERNLPKQNKFIKYIAKKKKYDKLYKIEWLSLYETLAE